MPRKTGYLANISAVPPLIFRFQFNPVMLSEKKSFKYKEPGSDDDALDWSFLPDTRERWREAEGWGYAGAAALAPFDIYSDVAKLGPPITNVKPLRAEEGTPRTFALEFQLLAGRLVRGITPDSGESFEFQGTTVEFGPAFADQAYERNVLEPDLAILRSFLYPGIDVLRDVPEMISDFSSWRNVAWRRPPECLFKYGDFALTCVVTDLNIKLSEYDEESLPQKADVSMTLKEQSHSVGTVVDTVMRMVQATKGLTRLQGEDWAAVAPIAGSVVYSGSLAAPV